MKIVHVINKFSYTSIPVEWANLMSKDNDVSIFSLYDSQDEAIKYSKLISPNCEVYGLEYKKHKLSSIRKLKKILQNMQIDIVHTHHSLSGAIIRYILRKNKKIKIVHTVHANHHSFNYKQNFIIGSTLKYADAIIFNSTSTRDGLLDWQKKKIKKCYQEVIYNGIDTKKILSISDKFCSEFIEKNKIADDTFVFAQIGRLEKVKNPLSSLKAFERLLEDEPNLTKKVKFIYVGNGSQKNVLENALNSNNKLKEHVILAGLLQRDDVYSLLKRIDALVVPSYYEGFCNALFEGMTVGTKLVISDIPVFSELVTESENVIRFNPSSIEDIENKLKNALSNKLTVEQKDEIRSFAISNYDTDICISNYIKLYRDLIQKIERT